MRGSRRKFACAWLPLIRPFGPPSPRWGEEGAPRPFPAKTHYNRPIDSPPSALTTVPVANPKLPFASAATMRPISSASPQPLHRHQTAIDQRVVFRRHARRHVGADNAGPHFEYRYAGPGQTQRQALRKGGKPGLAHAVIQPLRRCHRRRNRCDVDHRARPVGTGGKHGSHHRLREKTPSPRRLVPMITSKFSGTRSRKSPRSTDAMPALLTRQSIPPNSARTASTVA